MQLNELYCLEQLGEAVDRLAAGAGSIPDRLEEARLVLQRLDAMNEDEVPARIGPSLQTLKTDLNKLASAHGGEPTIARDTTSIVDCQQHARNILFLYSLMFSPELKYDS